MTTSSTKTNKAMHVWCKEKSGLVVCTMYTTGCWLSVCTFNTYAVVVRDDDEKLAIKATDIWIWVDFFLWEHICKNVRGNRVASFEIAILQQTAATSDNRERIGHKC